MGGSFKKFGDWDKAGLLTSNLKKDIEYSNTLALRQLGLKTERLVVKWIQKQPSSWPALSDKYKDAKEAAGYSGLMLRRTGSLINAITSYADKKQVAVGVVRGKKHPGGKGAGGRDEKGRFKKKSAGTEGGEDMANIAAIMEFGSAKRNIPPRPYLMPAYNQIRRMIVETKYFSNFLLDYLKKKYSIHK